MGSLYNMEETLRIEKLRSKENSFYDVFEKCSTKEMVNYKRMIGMPVLTISIEELKKVLTNNF